MSAVAAEALTPWCHGDSQSHPQAQREGFAPCCICGRAVATNKPYIAACVVNGGLDWGNDKSDILDAGYMGYYPVGSDCAQKLRAQAVQLQTLPAVKSG